LKELAFGLDGRSDHNLGHLHLADVLGADIPHRRTERTDKILRRLEALLLAVDATGALLISGTGDVIEPDEGVMAIGSGGPYALAAARALMAHTDLTAKQICKEAMKIAASLCVYTNSEIVIEEL